MMRFTGLPVAHADSVGAMAATKRKKGKAKAARTSTRRPTPRAKPAPKKKTKSATKPRSAKKAKSTKGTKGTKKASEQHLICGAHGETLATFVCRHVADGVACGFHANPPAPDDPWPDAWCDLCEEAFQRGGGEWNEQNEGAAEIKALCTHCYEAARERNSRVPRLARGRAATLTAKEASRLIHRAVHAAQTLQEKSDKKWRWQSRRLARTHQQHRMRQPDLHPAAIPRSALSIVERRLRLFDGSTSRTSSILKKTTNGTTLTTVCRNPKSADHGG